MRDQTYITVLSWMRDLDLTLVERTVYAVIYGFSQDGESYFQGSRQYLADWCSCTKKTIDAAIRSLLAKQLLRKRDKIVNGIKFCEYAVNFPTGEIISLGVKKTDGGREKISPNNDITDVISNRDIIEGRAREEMKNSSPVSRFTPPTLVEVEAYCRERKNSIDPQKFIDYYEANGWMVGRNKMKDWRAAVRNWETRDKEKINGTSRNIDKSSPAAYRHLGNGDYYGEPTL